MKRWSGETEEDKVLLRFEEDKDEDDDKGTAALFIMLLLKLP